jgi:NAD(P)-dependent dehydrogenase (short-subunit alcohol dehydrogenase family)
MLQPIGSGERCVSIQADISKMEDIDRIYKKIAGDGKALDVLFANAGGGSFAPLGSVTEEQYDATFTTNVKGTLFTVQKSLPHLNDGSSIILKASIASVKGIPGLSVYSAAKAALRSFARVWMMDLLLRPHAKIPKPRYWNCTASFFIAAFSRVTSPDSRLCKAISAAIERPRIR